MSRLDEAMKKETIAVYETPFYLNYPISETKTVAEDGDIIGTYPGKTIQEAEKWLNGGYPMEKSFMEDIMDDEDEYSDDVRTAVGEGLIKKFTYKFEDDQSGKIYIEAGRQLTDEEQTVMQEWLKDIHFQGWGDLSDQFNVFLGHDRTIDVWNTWEDAEKQTDFKLSEIPLEKYLSTAEDFAKAVEDLSAEAEQMML